MLDGVCGKGTGASEWSNVRKRDEETIERTKAEALGSSLLEDPHTPVVEVLLDVGVRVVDVRKHQIVIVAILSVHLGRPGLAIAVDL